MGQCLRNGVNVRNDGYACLIDAMQKPFARSGRDDGLFHPAHIARP